MASKFNFLNNPSSRERREKVGELFFHITCLSAGWQEIHNLENIMMKKNNQGFTLVELMVALGIVSIMAAVVLVSMNSYGAKARSSKALAQLSSAIPSMVSCWGNAKDVNAPSNGGNICGADSNYGQWPSVGAGTDLSTYGYASSADDTGIIPKSGWWVALSSGASDDNIKICCNKAMNNCKVDDEGSDCDGDTPSN